MFDLLTAPETLAQPAQAYRFMVELASDDLDFEGVPTDFKIIDIVTAKPTREAINLLVAAADWLKGYSIVAHWQPEDCDCF